MNWEISGAMQTDVGCHRATNEDTGRIVRPADPALRNARGVLTVVADGMGGHAAGEVASQIAVETIQGEYFAFDRCESPTQALKAAFETANAAIFARAQGDAGLSGMGTTGVALALCGDAAYVASVGDSRLYLVRAGRIYQMTVDDSAVREMVSQGVITGEQARHHHERNVILRALGTHATVAVSVWEQPFPTREHDAFVLCSDGLTDLVDDAEILASIDGAPEAGACRALVDRARERGGFDNITVAVLRLRPALAAPTAPVPATRESQVAS
jgi:serine/threonine protein phosphatase PrpC